MKGFGRASTFIIISSIASHSYAELKRLDDISMRDVTGQAGLTIDIETKRHTGEFAYKDAGHLVMQNFSFGGSTEADEVAFSGGHGYFDNRRYEVDIADGVESLGYGFSDMTDYSNFLADMGNIDSNVLLAAGITTGTAVDATTGLDIETRKVYGDGDLVVHFTHTDAWQKGGGFELYNTTGGDDGFGGTATFDTLTYEGLRDIVWRGLDWNVSIEAFGIASSDYEVGSRGLLDPSPDTTTLISNYSMNAYSGGWDIHIENNGNGFGADGSGHNGVAGTGNADSKIHVEMYYEVTDLDYYIDIAGVQITDLKLHNRRGHLGGLNRNETDTDYTSSFGMFHAKVDVYAVNDAVLKVEPDSSEWVDAMAWDLEWKGDVDIGALSFGDTGTSIGELYFTDFHMQTNHKISAH